jgi:uncharacterized membrane protein
MLYSEVNDLRANVNSYKLEQWQKKQPDPNSANKLTTTKVETARENQLQRPSNVQKEPQKKAAQAGTKQVLALNDAASTNIPQNSHYVWSAPASCKSNMEKFIGENLMNKIGVVITVIGVAIDAKYSIENNVISPLTRIIIGYLSSVVLLCIGMKLKTNYDIEQFINRIPKQLTSLTLESRRTITKLTGMSCPLTPCLSK